MVHLVSQVKDSHWAWSSTIELHCLVSEFPRFAPLCPFQCHSYRCELPHPTLMWMMGIQTQDLMLARKDVTLEPTPQPTRGPFFFKPSLSVKNQRLKLVRVQSLNLSDQLNQLLDNTSFGSVHKTMDNHSNRKLLFTSWLSLGKRASRKTSVGVLITTPAHIPLCSPKDS